MEELQIKWQLAIIWAHNKKQNACSKMSKVDEEKKKQ